MDLGIVRKNYKAYSHAFGGDVYYAVKANPSEQIIMSLWEAGIKGFDVASLTEIKAIRDLVPTAPLLYTHPIKTASDIHRSYKDYNIKQFSLDCEGELHKLQRVTPVSEVEVLVRLKIPIFGATAMQQLDKKFGADSELANSLIKKAKDIGFKTGVCFHVGSQQEEKDAHLAAVAYLSEVLEVSSGDISTLSIGGGFPASYTLQRPTDFQRSVPNAALIKKNFPVFDRTNIVSEPGRCLVADSVYSEVTVVDVDGNRLFIDDGVYGGLMDCGIAQMRFPITHKSKCRSRILKEFTVFGPTCDSLDVLPGIYFLPKDIQAGDTLIVSNTGAYGSVLAENFNGLIPKSTYVVRDDEIQMERCAS